MKTKPFPCLVLIFSFVASLCSGQQKTTSARTPPDLGEAPLAPPKSALLPERGAAPEIFTVTGPFVVNSDSREQVRQFYNAIYPTSENIPIQSTADVADCVPGTNSTTFIEGVLRRINWVRAMAGVPAAITFNSTYNADDQEMALMISANNTLNHNPPPSYTCYTTNGASVAGSDQAIGVDGADAITDFIWDFGGNNSEVGHRRWILLPQTLVMGTGDIPAMGTNSAANATWVFDSSINDPRPPTRQPYVSWPPEGYVPYQLAYPYWSFALSNADLSAATVSMTSNGAPVSTIIQPYQTGYGENTLVWVPMGLDATCECTPFPFNGTDTVYAVTVSNVKVGGSPLSFSYNVRLFDPSVPGTDYIPTTIHGASQPGAGTGNFYTATPPNNTNVTSYNWIVAQLAAGNVSENANYDATHGGLVHFTISPPPNYSVITNAPDGTTNDCFHLCHDGTNSNPQLLQLNELLFPASNAVVSFESLLGYATTDETARVQISIDGGTTWQDIFTEAGCDSTGNAQCETSFTQHNISLSSYAGMSALLRFNYDFEGGSYYVDGFNFEGWCLENIVVTNVSQIINQTTNTTSSADFTFTPVATGGYLLQAQPVIFGQFPLNGGPILQVNAVPGIVLSQPALTTSQVLLNFTVTGGSAATFHLLQASQVGGAWSTNASATLTTNAPGSSYRFTLAKPVGAEFYRVQTP